MKLPIYQVSAFTSKLFGGNPAAIIPLKEWLSDKLMQSIAAENNLSETAFFVKNESEFDIRWFTPAIEVDLCGHATLAAAYIIYEELGYKKPMVTFGSRSGNLIVRKKKALLEMDFPSTELSRGELPEGLLRSFNITPTEAFIANEDFFFVYDNEDQITALNPNFSLLKKIKARGIICTAKGNKVDFVSRFFAPSVGINEDPVTGSAHTKLIPFWAKRLDKKKLKAHQISARKGVLDCTYLGDRVLMAGKVVSYLKGTIEL